MSRKAVVAVLALAIGGLALAMVLSLGVVGAGAAVWLLTASAETTAPPTVTLGDALPATPEAPAPKALPAEAPAEPAVTKPAPTRTTSSSTSSRTATSSTSTSSRTTTSSTSSRTTPSRTTPADDIDLLADPEPSAEEDLEPGEVDLEPGEFDDLLKDLERGDVPDIEDLDGDDDKKKKKKGK